MDKKFLLPAPKITHKLFWIVSLTIGNFITEIAGAAGNLEQFEKLMLSFPLEKVPAEQIDKTVQELAENIEEAEILKRKAAKVFCPEIRELFADYRQTIFDYCRNTQDCYSGQIELFSEFAAKLVDQIAFNCKEVTGSEPTPWSKSTIGGKILFECLEKINENAENKHCFFSESTCLFIIKGLLL